MMSSAAWDQRPPALVRVPRRGTSVTQQTAQEVVAALALPSLRAASSRPLTPLPMINLHQLPRDGSLLYGIGHVDASGRVTSHGIVKALGWQHGDKLEVAIVSRAVVIRASSDGLFCVPQRPCIVIPVTARRHCGIDAGDEVLLAAAPDFGLVIVHPLSVLDDMLAEYHTAHSVTQ